MVYFFAVYVFVLFPIYVTAIKRVINTDECENYVFIRRSRLGDTCHHCHLATTAIVLPPMTAATLTVKGIVGVPHTCRG